MYFVVKVPENGRSTLSIPVTTVAEGIWRQTLRCHLYDCMTVTGLLRICVSKFHVFICVLYAFCIQYSYYWWAELIIHYPKCLFQNSYFRKSTWQLFSESLNLGNLLYLPVVALATLIAELSYAKCSQRIQLKYLRYFDLFLKELTLFDVIKPCGCANKNHLEL